MAEIVTEDEECAAKLNRRAKKQRFPTLVMRISSMLGTSSSSLAGKHHWKQHKHKHLHTHHHHQRQPSPQLPPPPTKPCQSLLLVRQLSDQQHQSVFQEKHRRQTNRIIQQHPFTRPVKLKHCFFPRMLIGAVTQGDSITCTVEGNDGQTSFCVRLQIHLF